MDTCADGVNDWPTGFMLIQGNRLEALRGLLISWLRRHPLHPLENEVILVQSNGIGQWLKLALAAEPAEDSLGEDLTGGCGIAAAVDLMLPGRFLWQAYRALLGRLPDTCAYDKAPLGWRLYRLLGELDQLAGTREEAVRLTPLRSFLDADGDVRRRHQLAERLADLYDQYQVYRADWLAAWQQGKDVLIRPDGRSEALPDGQRWQPLLWRLLEQDIEHTDPAPAAAISRAEIHERFLEAAASPNRRARPPGLPRRVIVFGISSLPRQAIEVLEAIAPFSQVMLFVHNPSHHYWGDIVEDRELFRRAYRRTAARKIPEDLDACALHLHGHPLLAAWGKQGRDYIRLLDEHDDRARYETHFQAQNLAIDLFESPGDTTLLRQLQDDILELRPLAERRAQQTAIDPRQDRSLEFLIAHSPQREVEILHDQLLDAFARAERAGRSLPPRDILVMVPDIATYASHIEAVFGRLPWGERRHIPFHIADQGQRQRNPLVIALEHLLTLPQTRCTVSELLDLLDLPALRARFGLAEADLPRLRQWVEGANIRWGLDAGQRAGLGLPAGLEQNTWQFGLQRMLLGFAAGGSGPWQDVEPFDEIGGLEAALIGPLAQLLETLARYWALLQQARSPADWGVLIATMLDDVFSATGDADELTLAHLHQALEQWTQDCTHGGAEQEVFPLEVVRESLLAGLDEPTLSQRFLAGSVNFATLMPMRAIPFRQIWLLGMNDGDYPRSRRPADFDLMADDDRPGDRSRREDDRYLFLEALLSARDRFVISWVGRSIRDNSERPPSVLVGQLRDHLAAGWQLDPAAIAASKRPHTPGGNEASGKALVDALTTEHPLQPFSRRYFEPGRAARLFTYASEWQDLHQALPPALDPPPRLDPASFDGPIDLTALGRFLRRPVSYFYTRRLAVNLERDAEHSEDEEPFDVDALGDWVLRDTIIGAIEQQLAAQPEMASEDCLHAAIGRLARAGTLPLPPFDGVWTEHLNAQLATPLERYRTLLADYAQPIPNQHVRYEAAGLVLEDTLSGLRADTEGNRLRPTLLASALTKQEVLKWYHLVRHWPGHLAAQLDAPTTTWLLGPGSAVVLSPLAREEAEAILGTLMEGFAQGLTELLPLACKTGFAWLGEADGIGGADPVSSYEGGYNFNGERDEHAGYRRFWPDYAALCADERFDALIDRLYRPLYAHQPLQQEL